MTHVPYVGGTIEVQGRLNAVVGRLPHEVRDHVLSRCVFLSVGKSNGGGLATRCTSIHPAPGFSAEVPIEARWFLAFSEEAISSGADADDADSLIAHEIAHGCLNDDGQRPHADAAERAREWGFRGYGANPDNFDETA